MNHCHHLLSFDGKLIYSLVGCLCVGFVTSRCFSLQEQVFALGASTPVSQLIFCNLNVPYLCVEFIQRNNQRMNFRLSSGFFYPHIVGSLFDLAIKAGLLINTEKSIRQYSHKSTSIHPPIHPIHLIKHEVHTK